MKKAQKEASPPETAVEAGGGGGAVEAPNVYSASESDDLDFGALEAQLAELEEMASAPLGAEGSEGEASPKSASLERSADAELNDLDSLLHEARRLLRQQKAQRLQCAEAPDPQVVRHHQVEDDFIRSFLVSHHMPRTLEAFQVEWYQRKREGDGAGSPTLGSGRNSAALNSPPPALELPAAFAANETLRTQLEGLKREAAAYKSLAATKSAWFDHFKKERDFYKLHFIRLKGEKAAAAATVRSLRGELSKERQALEELRKKHETALRAKALSSLERDKLQRRVEELEAEIASLKKDTLLQSETPLPEAGATEERRRERPRLQDSTWPPVSTTSPLKEASSSAAAEPLDAQSLKQVAAVTLPGEVGPTSLAFHPSVPLIAASGEDGKWSLWSLPSAELVMGGEGHESWISRTEFHPNGSLLLTASGDATVKAWSLTEEKCLYTLKGHSLPLWDLSIHRSGDFFLTASQDKTIKCFDLNSLRCRQTLREHSGSVNAVEFQPYTNQAASAASDGKVILWDLRASRSVCTLRGHGGNCTSVSFNAQGDLLASCDSSGKVSLWDLRTTEKTVQVDCTPLSPRRAVFDASSRVLIVACDDGSLRFADPASECFVFTLQAHQAALQRFAWRRFVVLKDVQRASHFEGCLGVASADGSFSVWQTHQARSPSEGALI